MNPAASQILVDISQPYPFSKAGLEQIRQNRWARAQWPLVYVIDGRGRKKKCYIGESTNAISRIDNHLRNREKASLEQILLIGSDQFNKSVTLDLESTLIQYMATETGYELLNGNYGLQTHNYYDRERYRAVFAEVWEQLRARKIDRQTQAEDENSPIFKYSPYKSLNEDQHRSLLEILDGLTTERSNRIFVEGSAGTGKTILATFLVKLLRSDIGSATVDAAELEDSNGALQEITYIRRFRELYPAARIGLVIAMSSLRVTLKKVFKEVPGLHPDMVISPSETVGSAPYDLLIVDEAHRLRQFRSISWMGVFRKNNEALGLDDSGTELDWIMKRSRNQIFFYDRDQAVRPSDVDQGRFEQLLGNASTLRLKLQSQMRVKGGADYIGFVTGLLNLGLSGSEPFSMPGYELLVFDSIRDMQREILKRDAEFGLSRMIAGYSWPWSSKTDTAAIDFEIEGIGFQWNRESVDWINSGPAENEIGSIHTTMGYDLNYAAVIFGPEISYNPLLRRIEIDRNKYFDTKGKQGIRSPDELKGYILNIYRNMMYRGIRGTFVYAVDPGLREYFREHIPAYLPPLRRLSREEAMGNDRAVPFVNIQVAAGPFSAAQLAEPDEFIELPGPLRERDEYFVCRIVGESMNRIIPNGAYCLFRRYEAGSREGKIVLVQSTEIQDADFGSGYTVKEYHSVKTVTQDGWRHEAITLRALSEDAGYREIELAEDGLQALQVIGIFQKVLQ